MFFGEFFYKCIFFSRLKMPPKLTHSQFCAIVCFVCGNESGKKGNSKINSTEVQLIREHVMPGYDPNDERFDFVLNSLLYINFKFRFPTSTCTNCRARLKVPHTLRLTNLYTSNLRPHRQGVRQL
jgi:hypothetical protein